MSEMRTWSVKLICMINIACQITHLAGLGHGGKAGNELLDSAKPVMMVNFVCYLGQAIVPRYLIKH